MTARIAQSLFRMFAYTVVLAKQGYTGSTEFTWKDGEVKFVRTESGRTPEELPGDEPGLVELLAKARSENA